MSESGKETVAEAVLPDEFQEAAEAPPTDASEDQGEEDETQTEQEPEPEPEPVKLLELVRFRTVRPTDIPACYKLERASYPDDEAASKSSLQYRQHHAAPYFRCAVLKSEAAGAVPVPGVEDDCDTDIIIGFVCSTRCKTFEKESMMTHVPDGPLLAIHSVVIQKDCRHQGIATALLKDYVKAIQEINQGAVKNDVAPISKIVLIAKKELLTFYIHCGFQVVRPSHIVHGKDQWYEIEYSLEATVRQKRQGLPCYIVDAFVDPEKISSTPSAQTGNPAAVVLVERRPKEKRGSDDGTNSNDNSTDGAAGPPADDYDGLDPKWMQTVASEFNLSETAFLLAQPSSGDKRELHYTIRYFTPTVEVALCGHATLASAAIVYQTACRKNQRVDTTLVFHAKQDVLHISYCPALQGHTKISMHFPCMPPQEIADAEQLQSIHKMLLAAFHIAPEQILFVGLASEIGDLLVELSYEGFHAIAYSGLNYSALLESETYTRGVILCCQAPAPTDAKDARVEEEYDDYDDAYDDSADKAAAAAAPSALSPSTDFLSRFFAPKAGINEDPVTGSAHCVLAPYYCSKLGKERVVGLQRSQRGGVVECRLLNAERPSDASKKMVEITGSTATTVSGTLWL